MHIVAVHVVRGGLVQEYFRSLAKGCADEQDMEGERKERLKDDSVPKSGSLNRTLPL